MYSNSIPKATNVEKQKVPWAGTSLSSQHLDKDTIEKKTNTRVDKLKVFTITREEGKKNKNLNAKELVPRALEDNQYDILVLELVSMKSLTSIEWLRNRC